jgi:hypothetical protein
MGRIFYHKDFIKLYPNIPTIATTLFDLRLVCYRNLKKDSENRLDATVTLERLEQLGFIKSHRYHSLILSESRNYNKIFKDNSFLLNTYGTILKAFELKNFDFLYKDYLPRVISSYTHSLVNFYNSNKKGINQLSKLILDPLIANGDWFIYDDESLSFLTNMGSIFCDLEETVKIKEGNIYFQDKLPYITLPNRDFKTFFLNITVGNDVNYNKTSVK